MRRRFELEFFVRIRRSLGQGFNINHGGFDAQYERILAHACRQVILAGPDDITRERLGDALGRRD